MIIIINIFLSAGEALREASPRFDDYKIRSMKILILVLRELKRRRRESIRTSHRSMLALVRGFETKRETVNKNDKQVQRSSSRLYRLK